MHLPKSSSQTDLALIELELEIAMLHSDTTKRTAKFKLENDFEIESMGCQMISLWQLPGSLLLPLALAV